MNPAEDICFETIYVGTRKMKYMIDIPNSYFIPYDNFHRDMRAMRALFWSKYGADDNTKLDTIIIMHKRLRSQMLRTHNYHTIANIPQIVSMIHNDFPTYNVEIISWEDYSVRQQVRIMARTKLMISLPGSAVMNAFLLQDDATLLCYCQKGEENEQRVD